jgi:hypothetical protein
VTAYVASLPSCLRFVMIGRSCDVLSDVPNRRVRRSAPLLQHANSL